MINSHVEMFEFPFLCLVFPEDFLSYDNEMNCKIKNDSIMQEFSYPNDIISNESDSRNLCSKYCGRQKKCWGCTFSCNRECKWIAVTNCDMQKNYQSYENASIIQKPGEHITKINLFIEMIKRKNIYNIDSILILFLQFAWS